MQISIILLGNFEASFATWRDIHSQVAAEFGIDAWQTVSAELAMNAARQRTQMSAEDQELSKQLTTLTTNSLQLIGEKKFELARPEIEKAAGISTRLWGKESFVSANINFSRALCYFSTGDYARSIAVLSDVLTLRISLTGMNHPDVESVLQQLAAAYNFLGQYDAAEAKLVQLLDVSKSLWGTESHEYESRCNDLGVAYNNNRKPLLAIENFNELVELRRKKYGDKSISVGRAELNRGLALGQANEFELATQSLTDAYSIFHKHELELSDPSWDHSA